MFQVLSVYIIMCIYSEISLSCSQCTCSHSTAETQPCWGLHSRSEVVLGNNAHPHSLSLWPQFTAMRATLPPRCCPSRKTQQFRSERTYFKSSGKGKRLLGDLRLPAGLLFLWQEWCCRSCFLPKGWRLQHFSGNRKWVSVLFSLRAVKTVQPQVSWGPAPILMLRHARG